MESGYRAPVSRSIKLQIGANISGHLRVYKSMKDEATALRKVLAACQGTETTEVTMFAGWKSQGMEPSGAGRLASLPANTLSMYPMRL